MTFFYDLNKRLAQLADKQDTKQISEDAKAVAPKSKLAQALNERDMGKHNNATTGFAALAKKAGKEYGSKGAGERVAGAQFQKMKKSGQIEEEGMSRAAKGYEKYGKQGMQALAKAGREGTALDPVRAKYNKYDESQGMTDEGNAFSKAVVDAKRDGIQKGEKIRVGDKELPLKELDLRLLKGAQGAMKGSNTDSESERNRHKKYGYRSDRDDTGNDDDYDEHGNLKNKKKAAVSDGPKKKGRPAKEKQPERVTAKSYKYKSGRPTKTKEGLDSDGVMMTRPSNMSSESIDSAEYNDEAGMTKDSLHTIVRHAKELENALRSNENMPEWVQEKVGQIKGMMSSVSDYIISSHERDAEQHMGREGITIEPMAEGIDQAQAQAIYNELANLRKFAKQVQSGGQFPQGFASQLENTLWSAMKLIQSQQSNDAQVFEKAVSQAQRKAAGIAHAAQKGDIPKSKLRGASKEMAKMPRGELQKFAATKETGLPKKADAKKEGLEKYSTSALKAASGKDLNADKKSGIPAQYSTAQLKAELEKRTKVKKTDEANDGNLANNAKPYDKVTQGDVVAGRLGKDEQGGKAKKAKEEKVDETTVSGSVAPTQNAAPKGTKGMQFGKGVYEGFNDSVEKMITESISIESKMQECGDGNMEPGITIQADGEDAAKLMMLLKLAGLDNQIPKACPSCGGSPCGCAEVVDENSPDWPTNTETLDADPNLRTYSGGLNGPKSTGQTTVPVVASQLRRQASMEESIALERSLFKTWQNYKG